MASRQRYFGFGFPLYKHNGEERLKAWLRKECRYFLYAHSGEDIHGVFILNNAMAQDRLNYDLQDISLPVFVYRMYAKIQILKSYIKIDPAHVESDSTAEIIKNLKRGYEEIQDSVYSEILSPLNLNVQ